MELMNFGDPMCRVATFSIISVGSQGCAVINSDPVKKLLTAAKQISCVAIATDVATLEACTAEHKICIPEVALSSANVLSFFGDGLPDADMVFIVTGDDNEADITISYYIAEYLRGKAHCVMGMALLSKGHEQEGYNAFIPLISITNATHMISHEEVITSIVKIFQCTIDVICEPGMIGIDLADVSIIFGSEASYTGGSTSFGWQAYVGYGVAHGDEKSQRAEQATKQALQKLSLSTGKTCKDAHAVLYSIRASREISGEEIRTTGEIIGESVAEDANIIYKILFVEDVESFEVQLIAVFGEKI